MRIGDLFGPEGFDANAVLSAASLRSTGVDAEVAFQQALEDFGLWVDGPVVPSEAVVRCAVRDKRHSNKKPGWYIWWGRIGTSDVYAGCYGDWRHGDGGQKWISCEEHNLSAEHRAEYERAMEKIRALRDAELAASREQAATEAQQIFENAKEVDSHPYLERKQCRAHGIKQSGSKLVIPYADAKGEIRTLQFIPGEPGAPKKLLKGGQKKGCYHLIGGPLASPVYIVEGYATGATVHELTGRPVIVAIDSGNLHPVIRAVRESGYSGQILIAADNDRFGSTGNTGVDSAQKAAGNDPLITVIVPRFSNDSEGTDFNDLYLLEGSAAALAQLVVAEASADDEQAERERAAKLANGTMTIKVTERETRQAVPFPVDGLERLTRWICDRTGAEYGVGPQMAALAVAALAASRRYRTPKDTGVHLYQMMSGAAYASDAKPLFNAVQDALHQSGLESMYCEQSINGPASLMKTLCGTPAFLYVKSDWGCKVYGPQGSAIDTVAKNLGEYYDKRFVPIRNPHELGLRKNDISDPENPGIYVPAVNLLVFVQDNDIGRAFGEHRMGRGINESSLFARLNTGYPRDPSPLAMPPEITARMREIRGLEQDGTPTPEAIFGSVASLSPQDLVCVDFSSAQPDQRYASIMSLSDLEATKPIRMQAKAVLRRLAAVLAIWQQPCSPVVTPAIMDWAEQFVVWSVKELISTRQFGGGDDETSSTYEKALAVIARAGANGMTEAVLRSNCRAVKNMSPEDRGKMIAQMIEDGDVIRHPTRRKALVAAECVEVKESEQ